jgi:hypothetical protein
VERTLQCHLLKVKQSFKVAKGDIYPKACLDRRWRRILKVGVEAFVCKLLSFSNLSRIFGAFFKGTWNESSGLNSIGILLKQLLILKSIFISSRILRPPGKHTFQYEEVGGDPVPHNFALVTIVQLRHA